MKNTIGNEITITLFGESHGPAIGCVLDGLPSGFAVDMEQLARDMDKRKAFGAVSTGRREADQVEILSGIKDGLTEGTPVAMLIRNTNVRRNDYDALRYLARPSHADYTAEIRYRGFQDASGGGHFSGRLTAPLTAAGSVLRQMLFAKGIRIGTHIINLHGIEDDAFQEESLAETVDLLNSRQFPAISEKAAEKMIKEIEAAARNHDSVGGILETVIIGLEPGIGEPEFDSVESRLAQAMFSVPAVKGIEFGAGFGFADMYGSQANDRFTVADGRIRTVTNNNGGINGGISNGMPVLFRTAVKPTPSIGLKQETVNFKTKENSVIETGGRHDPAVIHRARAVVDAMTAFVIADMLASHHGRQWLGEKI